MVGRTPPGFDSAGVLFGAVEGDDCKGCVACATCVLRAESWVSERPEITSPPATSTDASQKSFLEALFLSSEGISITATLFAILTAAGGYRSPGNRLGSGTAFCRPSLSFTPAQEDQAFLPPSPVFLHSGSGRPKGAHQFPCAPRIPPDFVRCGL